MVEQVFGRVLKELRKEKNVSQEKLAELSNLDRTFISLLERGLRQPSLSTLFKISKSLNIPASKIIERVEREL